MHTFQDSHGLTWELRLDIAAMERCAAAGVRFEEILGGKSDLLMRLRFDAPLIARAVAAICRPAFTAAGAKSDEEFMSSLDAKTLCEAKAALRDEVIDFFSAFDPAAGKALRSWRDREIELAALVESVIPTQPQSSGAESGAAQASAG